MIRPGCVCAYLESTRTSINHWRCRVSSGVLSPSEHKALNPLSRFKPASQPRAVRPGTSRCRPRTAGSWKDVRRRCCTCRRRPPGRSGRHRRHGANLREPSSQKELAVGLYYRQAQTLHVLGFTAGETNVAGRRHGLLVCTAGATLLAVVRGSVPHV